MARKGSAFDGSHTAPAKRTGVRKPSEYKKLLLATLAFAREAGAEQLKQIPGLGPAIAGYAAAVEKLAAAEDSAVVNQQLVPHQEK